MCNTNDPLGYPAWVWSRPVDFDLGTQYIQSSLSISSPEMQSICTAAKKNSIAVVLGFSENDHNSLYIAQVIISSSGDILVQRRKLKPTHMERTVFGDATGNSLNNVVEVEGVGRVGALACWEHCQPLLKFHTAGLREDIHVGAWPPVHAHSGGPALWSMSREGISYFFRSYCKSDSLNVYRCTQSITGLCNRNPVIRFAHNIFDH
jgi:nitrilase